VDWSDAKTLVLAMAAHLKMTRMTHELVYVHNSNIRRAGATAEITVNTLPGSGTWLAWKQKNSSGIVQLKPESS